MKQRLKRVVQNAALLCAVLSTSAMLATAPAFAFERWLNIHNESSATIEHVFVSCRDCGDWGPDQLGNYVIAPGETVQVDPGWSDGYCMFDLRATFDDGSYLDDYLNICDTTDWTVYDR